MAPAMALRLQVLTATVDPTPSVLIKGRKTLIGRSAECEVRLPDPTVSAHHATIRKRGDHFILVDEHSCHGTGVAAHQGEEPIWLAPESPRVLKEGETIWVGQIELLVSLEATQRGAATGQEELAFQLVKAGLLAAGFEATEQLVGETLRELTDLPDEVLPPLPNEELNTEPVGVAALAQDEKHPPWMVDFMVVAIALSILAGCAYGLYFVIR